jgi:hypothetical protein
MRVSSQELAKNTTKEFGLTWLGKNRFRGDHPKKLLCKELMNSIRTPWHAYAFRFSYQLLEFLTYILMSCSDGLADPGSWLRCPSI